jgi:chromate transport protein ChrA
MNDYRRTGGFGSFGATVILCLPSAFAVCSSLAIASGGTGSSALWFMMQMSQYIGAIGIVVAAVLTIIKWKEGKASRIALALMMLSVMLAIFLQWYAVHIYHSPWF